MRPTAARVMSACVVHCVPIRRHLYLVTQCHSATAKLQGCCDANPPMEISTALSQRWRFLNVSMATVTLVLWIVRFLQGRSCLKSGEPSCSQFVSWQSNSAERCAESHTFTASFYSWENSIIPRSRPVWPRGEKPNRIIITPGHNGGWINCRQCPITELLTGFFFFF